MDNLVTISKAKDNVLEFDVEITGIDTAEMSVQFVIEADGLKLGFDSEKMTEKKWSVKIPALAMLDTTAYPFHIDVMVDGYYFEPLRGSVNVVGTHSVYTSAPENITLAPGHPKAKKVADIVNASKVKEEPPKEEKVKTPEVPVVKPDRKFVMQPLKVKDGKELFKTLTDTPKPDRKTDDKLDDEILGIFKKAKAERLVKPAKTKEEVVPKKETENKKEVKPVEKPKKAVEEKPVEPKKEVKAKAEVKNDEQDTKTKETKKTETKSKTDKESKKDTKPKQESKPVEKPKKAKKKVVKESTKDVDAKAVAENILHEVTGMGGKKDEKVLEAKSNTDKVKDIIEEEVVEAKKSAPEEKSKPKKAGVIKKLTKDKKIISVDESKEQSIKDILKEEDGSDEETRTVTTKPFNKKDVTIH
jgi:hypothetical protein